MSLWPLCVSGSLQVGSGGGSVDDVGVGRRLVKGTEAEKRLEGGHRGDASVVTEDVEVLVADAAVGAVRPCLEVGDGAVRARQQLLAGLGAVLRSPPVVVAVP